MIDFTVSVLPHLEPFAGIAFALNLAYIGLPRFRYRQKIQEHVSQKLKEIDGEEHRFQDTDWYKGPKRLAAMKDDTTELSHAELPSESWAKGYVRLFEKHRDRTICIVLSFFLGTILALGSAHSAGHFGSMFGVNLMFLFGDASFQVWFFLLTFIALLPVFFVYRGNGVILGACNYADKQISDMKKTMQLDLQRLPDPSVVKLSEMDVEAVIVTS